LIDVNTRQFQRVDLPNKVRPLDLILSHDTKRVVFTQSMPGQPNQARLFVWDRDRRSPARQIGEDRGYYADPAFSNDDVWIYFAHNTLGLGTPLNHTNHAYAQMYRIHPDGTGFQQLTDEKGCHFAPTFNAAHALVYVHAACVNPERSIEVRESASGSTPKRLITTLKTIDELRLAPDGKSAILSATGNDTICIDRVNLETGQFTKLVEFRRSSMRARPTFGHDESEVFYLRDHAVWVFHNNKSSKLYSLNEGKS